MKSVKEWIFAVVVIGVMAGGIGAYWSARQLDKVDKKSSDSQTLNLIETRTTGATLTLLTIDEARALQKSGKAVFLDARPDREYQYAHIPNAIMAYYMEAKSNPQVLTLDRNQTVVAYCNSPKCPMAEVLATKLNEIGFTRIYVFPGGMKEWIGAKMPIQASEVLQ